MAYPCETETKCMATRVVTRVVTRSNYDNALHHGLFMLSKSFLHLDADSAR